MTRISTAHRRARLVARHHLGGTARAPEQAIRDLVALHSSDPLTPHLGLHARVPGFAPEALHRPLDAGALWRLHAMRRTLWVVAGDEVPVFDGAASRRIAAKERARVVGWIEAERTDADAWLAELEAAALAAIREAPGLLTRDLTARVPVLATPVTLGTGKWAQQAPIGSRLMFLLAMQGKVRRTAPAGSWRSSQYGWVAADVGQVRALDEAEARAALLRRYLERFGPVTFTDAKWWTGWTVAQTRRALADVGAAEVQLDGGEVGHVLAGDVAPDEAPPGVALLPGLDPTPMGYQDHAWFLGDHEAALFDRNGNVGPTIWADGRIVGGWAIDARGRVVTRLLEPADDAAVTERAAALEAWLDGASATPRFRTPLERALSA